MTPAGPFVSVILPALDEEAALPEALDGLLAQPAAPALEVILADGGSRDRTVALFEGRAGAFESRGWAARAVVCGERGRAAQMNAGAAIARGDVLLFLHADTRLPATAVACIVEALADARVVGGGFRLKYREPGLLLRLIAAWATLRSRILGIHYGDQAMFARRRVFEAIGGFPRVALFEDLDLARALKGRGRVRTLPPPVATSARRLLKGGAARSALRFAWLKIRHACGADPARLRADYPDVR